MSAPMTRDEVLRIVREARKRGERPSLYGANLSKADLRGLDLREADLSRALLCEADICGASLNWVDLRRANLSGANLSGANLSGANLSGVDLRWANLIWVRGGALAVDGLPSGCVRLTPTPDGWALRVGCWGDGTATYSPAALRDLIAGTDWPEAEGVEQDRRRPGLTAVADLCDAHAAAHPALIANLAKRWGTDKAVLS